MKRLLLSLLFVLALSLPCLALEVEVNGRTVEYSKDVGPFTENGTVLLPLYATAEALGAEVLQDNPHGTAIIRYGGITVSCSTGTTDVIRNGAVYPSDYGLVWRSGPLYVDARLFTLLDAKVYVGKEYVSITSRDISGGTSEGLGLYAILPSDERNPRSLGVRYEPRAGALLGARLSAGGEAPEELCTIPVGAYSVYVSDMTELYAAVDEIRKVAHSAKPILCVIEERGDGFGGVIENREVYIEAARLLESTGANLAVLFGKSPNCHETLYGDVEGYIERYRAFCEIIREHAPSAVTVFSVCGVCGDFEEYYPGDAYADYVGISACAGVGTEAANTPLSILSDAVSLYSYKKPMMIVSPLYDYTESYAESAGLDIDSLLLELYASLPIMYPQIKTAILLEDTETEGRRIAESRGYENALCAGLGASGLFGGDARYCAVGLTDGAEVPPKALTVYALTDSPRRNDHRISISINGSAPRLLEGVPACESVDLAPYKGENVTLTVSLSDTSGTLLSQKGVSVAVGKDTPSRSSAVYSLLALAFVAVVSVVGIVTVIRKIDLIHNS